MSNGFKYVFAFSLGAAVGAVVSWRVLKTKYEQIADDEIADVKERFYRRLKDHQTTLPKDIDEMHEVKDDLYEQAKQAMCNYRSMSDTSG